MLFVSFYETVTSFGFLLTVNEALCGLKFHPSDT